MSEKITIGLGEGGAKVEVEFTYDKGFRGSREEPPEPATVEIESVMFRGIDIIDTLHYSALEEVEDKIWKHLDRQEQDAAEEKADYLYHARKDEEI